MNIFYFFFNFKTNVLKETIFLMLIFIIFMLVIPSVYAGIALSNSRIIYPLGVKQVNFSVRNTDHDITYLLQAKVETEDGHKTSDFVVTPPIYISQPNNENILRLIASNNSFLNDREQLYYFVVKAVPGISQKEQEQQSGIVIATETRLKLFVRPKQLSLSRENAIKSLYFNKEDGKGNLIINNPTPYYFTLTDITVADKKVSNVMIAPFEKAKIYLNGKPNDVITYNSINDYGGVDKAESRIQK